MASSPTDWGWAPAVAGGRLGGRAGSCNAHPVCYGPAHHPLRSARGRTGRKTLQQPGDGGRDERRGGGPLAGQETWARSRPPLPDLLLLVSAMLELRYVQPRPGHPGGRPKLARLQARLPDQPDVQGETGGKFSRRNIRFSINQYRQCRIYNLPCTRPGAVAGLSR